MPGMHQMMADKKRRQAMAGLIVDSSFYGERPIKSEQELVSHRDNREVLDGVELWFVQHADRKSDHIGHIKPQQS